jgi:hypothetical protein
VVIIIAFREQHYITQEQLKQVMRQKLNAQPGGEISA